MSYITSCFKITIDVKKEDYNWACFGQQIWPNIIFLHYNCYFEVICTIISWYLRDKDCNFTSILLTAYNRIEQINQLERNYNPFMLMNWKVLYNLIKDYKVNLNIKYSKV